MNLEHIDTLLARLKAETEIRCPHCSYLCPNDDQQYPVSYWGHEYREFEEKECGSCEKKFYVHENVKRTYKVQMTQNPEEEE